MTKNEFWKYTNNITSGTYLDSYKFHMLITGLKNIRNLLLVMVNTDDDVRFNKAFQTLCDISYLLDKDFTDFD